MANDGRFEKGNKARQVHGGEAALVKIKSGAPLAGLGAEAETAVIAELDIQGRPALVKRNATRLQAAADLYWNAVCKAAQDGDLQALDRYTARFGWISSVALRAWAQVGQEDRTDDRQSVIDAALRDIKEAKHGDD
jgi:hypothetical protein